MLREQMLEASKDLNKDALARAVVPFWAQPLSSGCARQGCYQITQL